MLSLPPQSTLSSRQPPISKSATATNAALSVHGEKLGLSNRVGEGRMAISEKSVASKIAAEGLPINLDTVDNFCAKRGIPRIGFLKVDTEGHDLEALQGAERMLRNHHIDMV